MQHQVESPPAYRWVIIGSLTGLASTHLTIIFILGLLLPDISDDLNLSPSEQGWLGSSVLLANLFFAIPLNTLLSRYPPWRIVALLSLAVGAFALMQGWSPALAVLLIGRVVAGLCFTASMAPRALLIQQWVSRDRMAFTNGVWFGGVDLGMGIAFFITPLIMEWLGGWRNTFYFWGGVALLMAAIWIVFGKERVTSEYQERMESQDKTPLGVILKYPELWILGLGMIGAMIGAAGLQTFWPTLAGEKLGLSISLVGVTLGLMSIAAGPTDFLVNAVPTLVRKQPLVLAVGGLVTTGIYLGLIYSESPTLTLALGVAEGIFRAYFPVLMIMVFQMPNIKPREVGVGLAFMETCIWIGSAIGPLVVGFIQEATGDLRFAILVTSFTPLTLLVSAALLQARQWSPIPKIPVPTASVPEA
ncbi:MAG: CynX/NimT family MFS transporter [Dehalococcoidia bacterium]